MSKPSEKEVREYFKNAKTVMCITAEEELEINFSYGDGLHYSLGSWWVEYRDGDCDNSINIWDNSVGWAEIVEAQCSDKRILKRKDFQRIHDVACGIWKPKLLEWYGDKFALNKEVEIKDSEYKIMRGACTKEQNILFDEIFGKLEEETLIGKWHKRNDGELFFITKITDRGTRVEGYGFDSNGNWKKRNSYSANRFSSLMQTDIYTALKKEAKKRGFSEEALIKTLFGETILVNRSPYGSKDFVYNYAENSLTLNGLTIFKQGEWAEVIKKKGYPTFNKKDLPSYGGNIKVGSHVMIVDGSYMIKKGFENDDYKSQDDGTPIGHSQDVFEVKEINKMFPTGKPSTNSLRPINNCRVENTRTGEQWYCSEINIKSIKGVI